MAVCIECGCRMSDLESAYSLLCHRCRRGRPESEWRVPTYTDPDNSDARRRKRTRKIKSKRINSREAERFGLHIKSPEELRDEHVED